MLELRGSGASEKPGWFSEKSYEYSFDDYVVYDLRRLSTLWPSGVPPARFSGWPQHGYDGDVRVPAASGGCEDPACIGRRFSPSSSMATKVCRSGWPLSRGGLVLSRTPCALIAGFGVPWFTPDDGADAVVWNYDNISPSVARAASARGRQLVFGCCAAVGGEPTCEFRSIDGRFNYTQGLSSIEVPIFFVVGARPVAADDHAQGVPKRYSTISESRS